MTEDEHIQAVEKRIPLICLAEHRSANQIIETHLVNLADRGLFKMRRSMQGATKAYRYIPVTTASSLLLFMTVLLLLMTHFPLDCAN